MPKFKHVPLINLINMQNICINTADTALQYTALYYRRKSYLLYNCTSPWQYSWQYANRKKYKPHQKEEDYGVVLA